MNTTDTKAAMGRNFPDLACETLREQAATIALLWAKVARLESRADATGCHCDARGGLRGGLPPQRPEAQREPLRRAEQGRA
jgi:hypothetical protein